MTTLSAHLVASVFLLGQAACIGVSFPRNTSPEPRTPEVKRNAGKGDNVLESPAFAPKPVIGKQPPHLLLARDGTQCTVSSSKYERARLGTSVWCIWSETGR
jgi:hypothetical protein